MVRNHDKMPLKQYLKQLLFLCAVSLFISSIVVIYFGLFQIGDYFYSYFYHSPFFYIGGLLIAASSWLCIKYSIGARGSGHDLGKEYLLKFGGHESFSDKAIKPYINIYFTKKVIIIKILSSFMASCGGAALGREGPIVHMAMAALISWVCLNKCVNHS